MYIGEKNLDRLTTFVCGYIHGVYIETGILLQFLNGFQEYVEAHYGLADNENVFQHWSEIISFFNATKEEAFDEFYALMDAFLAIQA